MRSEPLILGRYGMRTLLFSLTLSWTAHVSATRVEAAGFPDVEAEVPLPSLTGNTARPLGMGGAGLAVSEDGSGLYWNPAGLAQMRRIEIATSLVHDRNRISTTWEGSDAEAKSSSTNLGNVHVVYPFPTYRGSFVIALGTDQFRNYDLEYERHTVEGAPGSRIDKRDTITESGKLTGWSVGMALEASPRLYLGGALFLHDGEDNIAINQVTEDLDDANPDTLFLDDLIETNAEISGWSGNFGLLYRLNQNWRLGAVVRTSTSLKFEGSQSISEITRLDNGTETEAFDEILFEDDIDFPVSLGFGAAFSGGGFTLASDVRYTDWSQIRFSDSPFLNRGLQNQYEEKTSLYLGGEYLIGASPFRVRAGFTYDPVPFRLLYVGDGRDVDVAVDRERTFVTAGAGVLLDTVFTIDAALQSGSFTRESALYSEERQLTRLVLSGAYRF